MSIPQHDHAWDRIMYFTTKWEKLLGFPTTITHRRCDSTPEIEGIGAETKAAWQYHQASIYWYTPVIAAMDDVELELTVVHELVHTQTNAIEERVPKTFAKECEYAVESVARMIWSVYNASS